MRLCLLCHCAYCCCAGVLALAAVQVSCSCYAVALAVATCVVALLPLCGLLAAAVRLCFLLSAFCFLLLPCQFTCTAAESKTVEEHPDPDPALVTTHLNVVHTLVWILMPFWLSNSF